MNTTIEIQNGVMVLSLNRPAKKNAFNDDLYESVMEALQQAKEDEGILVVVITGKGDFFSSGGTIFVFPL